MTGQNYLTTSSRCASFAIRGIVGLTAAVALMSSPTVSADDTAAAREPVFSSQVRPFLGKHCSNCHSGPDAEAGISFDQHPIDYSDEAPAAVWQKVLEVLQFDEMPPPDEERPDSIARANVILWIERQLADAGLDETYRTKLLNPEYGNYVSHELLFSGTIQTPPFSPSRLWRFSPQIFKRKGIREAQSPFSFVTSERGIRDYSVTSGVDQSTIEMILINTDQLLDHWTREGKFRQFEDGQPALPDAKVADFVRVEFRVAIGRFPSEQELQKYLAFLKKNMADGGRVEGLKTTIKAM